MPNRVVWSGIMLLLIIGIIFLLEDFAYVPCCDAGAYYDLAVKYNTAGILATKESLRTFAYPWILSWVIRASHHVFPLARILIFLLQITVYYFSIVVVSNLAGTYSRRLSAAIYLALCANVFVIAYTAIILTDSLYVSIAILLFAGMMKLDAQHAAGQPCSTKSVFWGALLLCLAVTIRPAAIWLTVPCVFCLAKLLWTRSLKIADVLPALLVGAAPLYFQIYLNYSNFRVFSFMPIQNLGSLQVRWGIENIKYATWLGGGPMQNFYPSGHLINISSDQLNMGWYFHHPVAATQLLTYKFIGAFDFDYLVCYPHARPSAKWIVSFFSFTVFGFGLFGVMAHLLTNRLALLGSRLMPCVVLLGWGSVSLVTALELRFTLPLISYFIIVACAVIHNAIVQRNARFVSLMVLSWIVSMPILFMMANLIRLQSHVH